MLPKFQAVENPDDDEPENGDDASGENDEMSGLSVVHCQFTSMPARSTWTRTTRANVAGFRL